MIRNDDEQGRGSEGWGSEGWGRKVVKGECYLGKREEGEIKEEDVGEWKTKGEVRERKVGECRELVLKKLL